MSIISKCVSPEKCTEVLMFRDSVPYDDDSGLPIAPDDLVVSTNVDYVLAEKVINQTGALRKRSLPRALGFPVFPWCPGLSQRLSGTRWDGEEEDPTQ